MLDSLSPDLKGKVQADASKKAGELDQKAEARQNAIQTALDFAKESGTADKRPVNVDELRSAVAAQSPEEVAQFDTMLQKLEERNVTITPAVLQQALEKQEERRQVLQNISNGSLDELSVFDVVDVTVSDDVKQMVEEGGSADITVDAEGVDEDTLVVAAKPRQTRESTIDAETRFDELRERIANGESRQVLEEMGNEFDILEAEAGNGTITISMTSFSPLLILTYQDDVADQLVPAKAGMPWYVFLLIPLAILVAVVVYMSSRKKKTAKTAAKK